ncbi:MAG: hypothetical protein AABX28_01150 [Nanoarchaeota archaeon]
MKTKAKFVGMGLTGRKIYLTPKEEAFMKRQKWTLIKTLLWIAGILIGWYILVFLWIFLS